MEKHYIYKLTSPSGKVYIGRTNDFIKRMQSHLSSANLGEKRKLYAAIRKHGWDNFTKEIIAEVQGERAAQVQELFCITEYDSFYNGYNCTLTTGGGDTWKGKRNTEQWKEFKALMKSLNQSGRMHGKTHTPETKAKQRKAVEGRFSLPWFQDKYGTEEGLAKYEERRNFLKNRKINKDANGKFVAS